MTSEECVCSICNNRFSCVSILRRHIKTNHRNVFCCPLCAENFQERNDLDGHLLNHTADIPSDDSASDEGVAEEEEDVGETVGGVILEPGEVYPSVENIEGIENIEPGEVYPSVENMEGIENIEESHKEENESDNIENDNLENDNLENENFEQDNLEKDNFEKDNLEKDNLEKDNLEKDNSEETSIPPISESTGECDVTRPEFTIDIEGLLSDKVKYTGIIPLSEMNTDHRKKKTNPKKPNKSSKVNITGTPSKEHESPAEEDTSKQSEIPSPAHLNVQDYIASFSQSLAPQYTSLETVRKDIFTEDKDMFEESGEVLDLDDNADNFKSTLFTMEGDTCSECGMILSSPEALYQHLSSHHSQLVKSYSCLYCSNVYFSSTEVMSHLRTILSPATPDFIHLEAIKRSSKHPCPVCDENHLSAHKLKLHILKERCSKKQSTSTVQCQNITKSKLNCMKLILQQYKPKNVLTEPATTKLYHATSTLPANQTKSYQELYTQSTYLPYHTTPHQAPGPPTQLTTLEKKGYHQNCACGSINCRSCHTQPQRPTFTFLQPQQFRGPVYTTYNNQHFTPLYQPQIQSNLFTQQQSLQFPTFPNTQPNHQTPGKGPITAFPLSHMTHNTQSQPGKGPMACFQCNRKYDNFEVLLEHVRTECQYTQPVQ